jgi:hypothetical protein
MSYAVGVDVPVSQMPAGMAFNGGGTSGGGTSGGGFLGSIGSAFLKGLGGSVDNLFADPGSGSSGQYGSPRSSYTDDTKRLMQAMLLQSMENFDPSRIRSTIGTI